MGGQLLHPHKRTGPGVGEARGPSPVGGIGAGAAGGSAPGGYAVVPSE